MNPKLSGGPLKETYRFDSLRFRWGPNDEEGSEHTIDARRYTMEVQAIHVKDNKKYSYLHEAAADKSVLILSYLFEVIDFEFLFIFSFVFSPLTYSVVYDINVSIYLPSLLDILKLRDASDVTRYYLIND